MQTVPRYLSELTDGNIVHSVRREVLPLSDLDPEHLLGSELRLIKRRFSMASRTLKWRRYVLSKIFGRISYSTRRTARAAGNVRPLTTRPGYTDSEFIEYEPNEGYIRLAAAISQETLSARPGYVLINQRSPDDRHLHDHESGQPLEQFLAPRLASLEIPFKSCDFGSISPRRQAELCGGARVLVSAHGAGNSNVIFTPRSCSLVEVNFRKYWFCDGVCDEHFSGRLKYDQDCDGTLGWEPYFHKADFHNLCFLLGRRYVEVEAEAYAGYNARNPISRKKVFVGGDRLVSIIKREFAGTSDDSVHRGASKGKRTPFVRAEAPRSPDGTSA